MSFRSDIAKFNAKAERAGTKIFRGTAMGLFGKIIKRTPVLTGRLIGNWQADVNKFADGVIESTGSSVASNSAKSATAKAMLGDKITIVNNLPYAGVIESGDSKKAPNGMIKVTVAEFKQHVRAAAR